MKENYTLTKENFFDVLYNFGGIEKNWKNVFSALKCLQKNISLETECVFYIYFSLLDDGNICISLEKDSLCAKWLKKWRGLLFSNFFSLDAERHFSEDTLFFEQIIYQGLLSLNEENLPNLIQNKITDEKTYLKEKKLLGENSILQEVSFAYQKPFVIDDGFLFATKYYEASEIIKERIGKIFLPQRAFLDENSFLQKKNSLQEYFLNITKSKTFAGISLKDEQLNAIVRGLSENLIITGGPGTGKTTVVCYLLWELFKEARYRDYKLFLAAPSGKAAERLKESISNSLATLNELERKKYEYVFEKLSSAQSSTIHRLLGYRPSVNGFLYNKENQFNEKTVFVIDEASMIDISLFGSLLQAIPKEARIFILGDKNQLPSVQAGAVLGELLEKKTQSVVALKESNRFNDNSEIGRLKDALQSNEELNLDLANFCSWEEWKSSHSDNFLFDIPKEKEYPVTSFNLNVYSNLSFSEKKQKVNEIIFAWSSRFYKELSSKESFANNIPIFEDEKNLSEKLESLWTKAISSRILSAEKNGMRGCEEINKNICAQIIKNNSILIRGEEYYPGELLMMSKNLSQFRLFNGDTGLVVTIQKRKENSEVAEDIETSLKYLMLKKDLKLKESKVGEKKNIEQNKKINPTSSNVFSKHNLTDEKEISGIFQIGSFVFYPLYLIPKDSLETAYAITIHKSQGSEYKAVLIFLPEQIGHPLLNRQIVYTAITRTAGSTYIVSSPEALKCAKQTVIERDTRIEF